MAPLKQKVSLSAITLAAIAAICWLGLRGVDDPAAAGTLRRTLRPAPQSPVMADGRKPTGDAEPTTVVKRRPSNGKGKTLVRKARRRSAGPTKQKHVVPQS